eukprot:496573_1
MNKFILRGASKKSGICIGSRLMSQTAQLNEVELLSSINSAIASRNKDDMETTLKTIRSSDITSGSSQLRHRIGNLLLWRHLLPNYSFSINQLQREGCIDVSLAYNLCEQQIRSSNQSKEITSALLEKNSWAMCVKDRTTFDQTFNCLLKDHASNMIFTDFLDLTMDTAYIGAFDLFDDIFIRCQEASHQAFNLGQWDEEKQEKLNSFTDIAGVLDMHGKEIMTHENSGHLGYTMKSSRWKLEKVDGDDPEEVKKFIRKYQDDVGVYLNVNDPFKKWLQREADPKELRKTGSICEISPFLQTGCYDYMTGPWLNDTINAQRLRRIGSADASENITQWKMQSCVLKKQDAEFEGALIEKHAMSHGQNVKEVVRAMYRWVIEVEEIV